VIDVLRSPGLAARGVIHGFSTRRGGVSTGVYAGLNLSNGWGDDGDAVSENRRRFAAAVGYAPARLYTARQVHGTEVIDADDPPAPGPDGRPHADALLTRARAVGVYTADCVPILLHAEGAVCAVHAGWRGAAAGIVTRAAAALAAHAGAAPGALHAAIGPSIGPCCFEVGPEVVAAFAARHAEPLARPGKRASPHLDLWRAVRLDLERAGVVSIDAAGGAAEPPCTMCDSDRFYSFRRDGRGGQQLSVIAIDSAPAAD